MQTLSLLKSSYTATGFLLCLLISCSGDKDGLTLQQSMAVKDSLLVTTELIARDIGSEGPAAWLRYFENPAAFFYGFSWRAVVSNARLCNQFCKPCFG